MSLISSNLADIELDFNGEYEKWKTFFNKITLNNNLPDFPKLYSTKEKTLLYHVQYYLNTYQLNQMRRN